jgi:hypothetical protein
MLESTHTKHAKNNTNPHRDIAYSMDALIPGLYFWFGNVVIRIGGSEAEDSYPGTIHRPFGATLVLPGYRIFTTYQGNYDPR